MNTRYLAIISLLGLSTFAAIAAEAVSGDGPAVAAPPSSGSSTLTLPSGQSRVLKFPNISRAAIGNPAVADIAVLSKTEVLLNAKTNGETLLYVQNAKGSASITVRVFTPAPDTDGIADAIREALQGTNISASVVGGTVFLRGTVDTSDQEKKIVSAAKALAPKVESLITVSQPAAPGLQDTLAEAVKPYNVSVRTSGSTIVLEGSTTPENAASIAKLITQYGSTYQFLNLVADNVPSRQIVIHARVVDVQQGSLRELGVDWGALGISRDGTLTGVGQPIVFGEVPGVDSKGNYGSTAHNLDSVNPIKRLDNIGAALQALEQNNRAKVLASPDILVRDNHKAEIVVGGQIPVPVPQAGGTTIVVVIEWKEFGVKLQVTPRILTDGSVSMNVRPEVSTLDYTNAVLLNGFRIPAINLRRADTDVQVQPGSTLVIGGLLMDQDVDALRKIPILSDVPILGELFKWRSRSRAHSQLVILVTPEVLEVGQTPPVPAVAELKPNNVKLPDVVPSGDLKKHTDPPAMNDVPPPAKTPIPMVGRGAVSLAATTIPA
ncbi:MAG TPA: pilus assembly protein N-terminal domain-containing protein [Armatimonadota bacterium]|jgi:pilus assembly protein CpaC